MANHLHQQIRAALVTKLTGLTTTTTHVFTDVVAPLADAELPALVIELDSERAEEAIQQQLERRLIVSVAGIAKAVSGVSDTLDTISKEVEAALAAGITVAGRTLFPTYTGMAIERELAGKQVGAKRLTFELSFYNATTTPDTLA